MQFSCAQVKIDAHVRHKAEMDPAGLMNWVAANDVLFVLVLAAL